MSKVRSGILCVWLAAVSAVLGQPFVIQAPEYVNPMILEGTQTLHVSGFIDDDGDNLGLFLGAKSGFFYMDYLELGAFGALGFRGSDYKQIALGGYAEYHFDMGTLIVPYAGAQAGLGWWDSRHAGDAYLELMGYGGARYFFVDHGAIGAQLGLKVATDELYNYGRDSFDWEIRILTSWYF